MSTTAVSWPYYLKVKPIVQWLGMMTPAHLRKTSAFRAGFGATVTLLERELEHLTNVGRRQAILQMALREQDIRQDGYPRANARPDHPGVIVTIESKWGPLSYPCDTYDDWQDNLRAIAKSLENLRSVERHGVLKLGEQYKGSKQLEAGPTMTQREAALLLIDQSKLTAIPHQRDELAGRLLVNEQLREQVWRMVLKRTHPDTAEVEDLDLWNRVNKAKRLVS